VLVVHCFYQHAGGEDSAYRSEVAMLRSHGVEVDTLELHNDALSAMSKARAGLLTLWNGDAARTVVERVRSSGARVVHFHNTFPLLSPAVYRAARESGARVVHTLHNFRMVCPSALLMRDGVPCESCVGRSFAWPGVVHGCYRGERAATAVVATMTAAHRVLGTWERDVDAYVTLSSFARARLVSGGVPDARLHVKAPSLDKDPGVGAHDRHEALFVGRLFEEKGVQVLLDAWRSLPLDIPLRIVGDGPLAGLVRDAAASDARITWEGRLEPAEVMDRLRRAWLLLLPSICYENAPVVIAEAAATGLPVLASALGSIPELVLDGVTGMLAPAGDAAAFAGAVSRLHDDPDSWAGMSRAARARYETEWTSGHGFAALTRIYDLVLAGA
jgi:glycosyltransferase involved in cell wall biosynthesis